MIGRREPLRVCVLSDSPYFYPPFTAGGSVGQLLQLIKSLRQSGVEAFGVARAPRDAPDRTPPSPDTPPMTYIGPAGEQRGKAWAALVPNLLFVVRAFVWLTAHRNRYDIVLVSGFRLLAVPAALAARLLRKQCIVRTEDANDLTFTLTKESTRRMGSVGHSALLAIVRVIYWTAFRLSHRLIAFTPGIAKRLKEMGAPPGKVCVIPNGLDVKCFQPADRDERLRLRADIGLPPDKIIFVYTGRLTLSKGVMDLINVWIAFAADRRDVMLVLLGVEGGGADGCEARAKEALAASRLENSVCFVGAVQNVSQYLRAADLFIFLSHAEMLSLSVLEAMAVGLPSLLTAVGLVEFFDRHQSWVRIVEPGAPRDKILEQLNQLVLSPQQWPAMGAAARSMAIADYSIESVTTLYQSLFHQLESQP